MDKIVVKHSSIHINDYVMGDSSKLEYTFSIWDKLRFTNELKILEYDEINKVLMVPRGMDIYYLENIFNTKAVIDYNYDKMDYVSTINLKHLPRDNVQKEALAFMMGEKDYKYNKKKSQLSVNLNTGKGKTYCAITACALYSLRSIIIAGSIDWLEQWRDCILEYTDTLPSEIYMLVGSASIHRLLNKDMSQYKFILASHDTIKSYSDKNGWDKLSELFKYMRVGLKFYDEAHLNFANMAKIDAYTNTHKTYYITATPLRSDQDENVLYSYYFKNVPSINLFNEEEDPHTNYIAMRYNSRPNPMEVTSCNNPYGFDKNKYSTYVLKKENFYKVLRIVIDLAISNGQKNVFYIAKNEAIASIYEWIIFNYPELINDIGVYNSTVKVNKEEQLEKRIILSTTKSLGTAKDIKGLKMVVVLAEPFASKVLARQTLGRTRNADTYYIDIIDDGFAPIKRYYNEKKDLFRKYACSMTEIKLSNEELDRRVNNIMNKRATIIFPIIPIQFININEPVYPISFIKK